MRAILALEDGRTFSGTSFGAQGTTCGEAVFNTAMTGYQEVLTDPSYRGQFVVMTYPLIGNYGTNALDAESAQPHVSGFVIEELSPVASSWRSERGLKAYFQHWNIPGIQGVDTRALTKHLRERGAMRACLTSELGSEREAVEHARGASAMEAVDYVKEVTARGPYVWDPDGTLSRKWTIVKGRAVQGSGEGPAGERFEPLPPIRHRLVAYDFGIKHNILRELRQAGFGIEVVPATTPADEVLARKPDGVFLSNGPGDPAVITYAHEAARALIGKVPIFGICLGHQVLGYAFGGKRVKLKFGHHGGNHPVKDLATGKVAITSQNHNYAVAPESLPSAVEVTHVNLNDGTVEGMRHREHPVFSIQYHPEAAPGPHDSKHFFADFAAMIETAR